MRHRNEQYIVLYSAEYDRIEHGVNICRLQLLNALKIIQ